MLKFALLVSLATVCMAFPQKPEAESTTTTSGIPCGYSMCGKNAVCDKSKEYEECLCKPGFYGSPYGADSGCTSKPECVDDSGCPDNKSCSNHNLCINPCVFKCADVGCKVRKHVAECIYDGQLFWKPYEQTPSPPTEGSGSTEASSSTEGNSSTKGHSS